MSHASRMSAQNVQKFIIHHPRSVLDVHSLADLRQYVIDHQEAIENFLSVTLAPIAQAEIQALHMRLRPELYRR